MIASASMAETAGRLLGIDDLESIESIEPSLAAPWARAGAAWVFFACVAALALALLFYLRLERRAGGRPLRSVLGIARGVVLALLIMILAEPVAVVTIESRPRPHFWILFDGSESMAIEDDLSGGEGQRIARAAGLGAGASPSTGGETAAPGRASRLDLLRSFLVRRAGPLFDALASKCRLDAFVLDRAEGVRALDLAPAPDGGIDLEKVAAELGPTADVTALGAALTDLARRHASGRLGGILVASDFGQNSGPPPLEAAEKLGAPVHTLGLGPEAAVDVSVALHGPPVIKKAERSSIAVLLRQAGLEGASAAVRLSARPMAEDGELAGDAIPIGERSVRLSRASEAVSFPFTPEAAGRFVLIAEVVPLTGESVEQNNRAERDVLVRDEFLRILYVEFEPTWEWRFIKETFHRDRLVGMRGFRTFLRSADPKVRETNELFLPTLTPPRGEFFATDVIFLGDMPAAAISSRFAEMAREFVSRFGGGLVVVAGPRFGPGELEGTALGDMLPVVLDSKTELEVRPFRPRLSPEAFRYDFMRLGDDDEENARAWGNLGELPWYRPVLRLHPLATALLEHPRAKCAGGAAPQPIIAIRPYGKGEVVYAGTNEMWRLRRLYGERYYRRFWGQMIHRLGLSHALGSQKRFVVRTDRPRYSSDDTVVLTVEAYDEDYEPLGAELLEEGSIAAELLAPDDGGAGAAREVRLTELRRGVFEARVPVFSGGEHRVRVHDPITDEVAELTFQVAALSVERRSAVRNAALERELAAATGGRVYDLETIHRLPEELDLPAASERSIEVIPLWNTWLAFALVVLLLAGEWTARKLAHLP